jgi:hypothetical protein
MHPQPGGRHSRPAGDFPRPQINAIPVPSNFGATLLYLPADLGTSATTKQAGFPADRTSPPPRLRAGLQPASTKQGGF